MSKLSQSEKKKMLDHAVEIIEWQREAKRLSEIGIDRNTDGICRLYDISDELFSADRVKSLLDELTETHHQLNDARRVMQQNNIVPSGVVVNFDKNVSRPLYGDDLPQAYFLSIVSRALTQAKVAIEKFPQPNYVLNKVAEESGEVIKAAVHYREGRDSWQHVESEVVDNIAMLFRLVTEGDGVIGLTPPKVNIFTDLNKPPFEQGVDMAHMGYTLLDLAYSGHFKNDIDHEEAVRGFKTVKPE